MSDLWVLASQDIEAETEARKFSMARVATAQYFPIVLQATSEAGVENACSILADRVTAAVAPIADGPVDQAALAAKILDSFVVDWNEYRAARNPNPGYASTEGDANHIPSDNPPAAQSAGEYAASHKNSEGVAPWGSPDDVKNSTQFWKLDGPAAVGGFNPTAAKKNEHWLDTSRRVMRTGQHEGGIDFQTAHHLVTMHDALKPEHQSKFKSMDLGRASDVAYKLLSKHSTIGNAPERAAEMEAQWGLPTEPIDTAEETQNAVDAWERTPHDTRIREGNGIGVADESSGRNVAGPGANNGEDPQVTGVSGDEDLHTHAYLMDEFGGLTPVSGDLSRYSNLVFIADDDDQVDENEDMQSEGARDPYYESDEARQQKEEDEALRQEAIKVAKQLVDRMPKEASVPAVKKEMLRIAAQTELNPQETEMVVSAAVEHAYFRGRRPLDKESTHDDRLLKKCRVCGKEIPASEMSNHMKKDHPHEVESKLAVGPGDDPDSFAPSADSGTSLNEDSGGGANNDDMTGSDPGGLSSPSNLEGESVGGTGASADIAAEENGVTTAKTSHPRTKPSHNPNAPQQPQPQIPMMSMPMGGAPTPAQNHMMAHKLCQMVDGILGTNPGMTRIAALKVAQSTLERYPGILSKEARGGADWPWFDEGTYSDCPQCGHKGYDARVNTCHNCGWVNLKAAQPGDTSQWDALSGSTTIKQQQRNLKNPGIR